VPLVLVDRPIIGHKVDEVVFANRAAMYELGSRLIALGHRRILFCVQQPSLSVTIERREGLNRAVSEAGVPVAAELLIIADTEEGFIAQIGEALSRPEPPTAIIASNSLLARWMLLGVIAHGARYPQDVSLVAFGEPDWAELVTPTLSVVRQPTREIALGAWELLIRRMNREEMEPVHIEIEGQLILRDSVGPPPAGRTPPRVAQFC
jgi:LacI family transcriptional regulator